MRSPGYPALLLLLFASPVFCQSDSCQFTIVAGLPAFFGGDGGPAAAAILNHPQAIAVDFAGILYIADTKNNRIRKVNSAGIISTFLDLNAGLSSPAGILAGPDGSIYISDTGNHRVIMATPAGLTHVVAGTGHPGFSGDGGAAVMAELNGPAGLALDALGNLYVADTNNNRIRRIGKDGIVSTVAGSGLTPPYPSQALYGGDGGQATSAQLSHPLGVTFDAKGNLLITEPENNALRSVNSAGIITTLAGGPSEQGNTYPGPALGIILSLGMNVFPQPDGAVIIPGPIGILQLSADGTTVSAYQTGTSTTLGPGSAMDAQGNLYATDSYTDTIWRIPKGGAPTMYAGRPHYGAGADGTSALDAAFYQPAGIAAIADGSLYVADAKNNRVVRIAPDGTIQKLATLTDPEYLAVDGAGVVYVSQPGARLIKKIAVDGTVSTFAGGGFSFPSRAGQSPMPATQVSLAQLANVVVHPNGSVYGIVNPPNSPYGSLFRITPDGQLQNIYAPANLTSGLTDTITGLAVDKDGNLELSVRFNYFGQFTEVGKLDPSGKPLASQQLEPAGNFGANLAVTSTGARFLNGAAGIEQVPAGDGLDYPAIFNRSGKEFLGPVSQEVLGYGASPVALATDNANHLFVSRRDLHQITRFDLNTCVSGPGPAISASVSSANFMGSSAVPGELVSIFGANMGPSTGLLASLDSNGLFPTSLAGVRVLVEDIPGPVLYAGATQINAVIPFTMYGRQKARMQVEYNGVRSNAVTVQMANAQPAVWTGSNQQLVFNPDGTLNSSTNPVAAGMPVVIYMTGLGLTTPAGLDGHPSTAPYPQPQLTLTAATSFGTALPIDYVGDAPGLVEGLSQVNVRVPSSSGLINLSIGGVTTSFQVFVK